MRREGGARANEYVPPTHSQEEAVAKLQRAYQEEKYTLGIDVKDDGSREVKLHRKNKKILVKTKRKLEGDHTENDPEMEMRATLAQLGYPNKEVTRLMNDISAAEKIVSNNLPYSNPKIPITARPHIEKVAPPEPITEHADIIKKIGAWLPGAVAKAAYNKIKTERNLHASQIKKISKNWLPEGNFRKPEEEAQNELVFELAPGDTLIHPKTNERYQVQEIPDYVAFPRDPRQEEKNYFHIKNPDSSISIMDTHRAEAWIKENELMLSDNTPKERSASKNGRLWWENQEDTQPRISRYEVPKEAASISPRFREEDAREQKFKDERYIDAALRSILPKLNENETVLIKGGQIIIERKIIDIEGIKSPKTQYLPYEEIAKELEARETHKRKAHHVEHTPVPVEKGISYWEEELKRAQDPQNDPKGEGIPDQKFIAFIERKLEKLRAQEPKEKDKFKGYELMNKEELLKEFAQLKTAVNSINEDIKTNALPEFKKVQALLLGMRGK